ncbi:N-acetyltransferase [Arcobacter sp. F155]|uniref:N-acetyltransferase n=1 Tax=Arcobacter sp. F155 TaxID=2044512 RepID=UPI00100A3066|nr:N-acetyltransferase [Arcobacter sp. F155]RXJ77210.1 N-acetyltransferase [Arcobacter sp. F155]
MIEKVPFSAIDLSDIFFNSLKIDYIGFNEWFNKKALAGESAYIMHENNLIQAFIYLKVEDSELDDVIPSLPKKRRIKIGTMKINPHGTRLGEKFLKLSFQEAINESVDEVYVTVFEKHKGLVSLLKEFGFEEEAKKSTTDGIELVLIKDLSSKKHQILNDYPFVDTSYRKFLLGIYPQFHTILFPDSILNNENADDIIMDISHTNSIHKIYICKMNDVNMMNRGDNLIIYRTKNPGSDERAWFKSVATTLCVVEEVKSKNNFDSIEEYLEYCKDYSIFTERELRSFYRWQNLYIIKFLYNVSFDKRVTMQKLVEDAGLDRRRYWGFSELSDEEYFKILDLGKVDMKYIR